MHLSGVLLGVDGHGADPQLGAGSEHPDGDLAWRKGRGGEASHLKPFNAAMNSSHHQMLKHLSRCRVEVKREER